MKTTAIPEERIQNYSDHQLLALLLGNESKSYISVEKINAILTSCNNDWNQLYAASMDELVNSHQVRFGDALRIKAVFELIRRNSICDILKSRKIQNNQKIREFLIKLSTNPFEEVWVIVLSINNQVLAIEKIGEGGCTSALVDIKRILHTVLKHLGEKLIVVHNHPYTLGLSPSNADISITEKIQSACRVLNIRLTDHVIVGQFGCYSLKDNKNIPM